MSKQIKGSSEKLVACAVALCMILGILSPTLIYAQASVGTDIEGHWAQAQIERWVDRGIVKGYEDSTFRPENPIKRCEFAALINRTFGFEQKAKVSFVDIEGTEWFFDEVAKAVAAGYMLGDAGGTFRPEAPISRQEAALVLARLYDLKDPGKKHLFKDVDDIASWSYWAVMAVVDAGLMQGYPDGTFGPTGPIKRSETVTVLDRLVAELFTEKGVYGEADVKKTITGNVHVLADGVEIHNTKITGDLLIAQSVGEGTVILDDVTVDGKVKVQGGGNSSIILRNAKIGVLEVAKTGVRIVAVGTSEVGKAHVKTPAAIVQEEVEGVGIQTVVVEEIAGEGVVTLTGKFEEVKVVGRGVNVVVPKGQVENLTIEAPDAVVELGADASITDLIVEEPSEVKGSGKITNATINASGTVIEPEPENLTIPEEVTVIIAGEEVAGGEAPPSEPVGPPVGPVVPPEPEEVASTYKFSYTVPEEIIEGKEVAIDVTFATDVKGDFGYDKVRFKFVATGPEDANVTFKATDTNNVEHTFTNEGVWGPETGFALPAEYTATTNWKLTFDKAGEYTIIFKLVDLEDNEAVIAEGSETITVLIDEAAIQAALDAVNAITGTAADVEVIKNNAEILGLDLTAFNALDDETGQAGGRQTAVMKDLAANKPDDGYNQAQLKGIFDSIVAVRTATQASMDLVNNATELKDIAYVEDLLAAFKAAKHTIHSGIPIAEKINTLQDLVNRYEALPSENQEAVLQAVLEGKPYARSQATTEALDTALIVQEGLVNDGENTDNYSQHQTANLTR